MLKYFLIISVIGNIVLFVFLYVLYIFGAHETQYAQNYSELRFDQITCASTPAEVKERLGPPLYYEFKSKTGESRRVDASTDEEDALKMQNLSQDAVEIEWVYSKRADPSKDYLIRTISFNTNNELVRVYKGQTDD